MSRIAMLNAVGWAGIVLVLAAGLAGCAPLTPEQLAAIEEQQRRLAAECQGRGGWFVSGSCVSRGGGV